jgi:hypothetical protein
VTQLCTVRGCRIRNRHLGDCDDDRCGGCLPRVADEGYTCDHDVDRTAARLTEMAQLAPDARLVAAGLVRHGAGGGASGKPGSRPPLNSGATDALDAIQNRLTTLARDIAETRGLHFAGTYRMDLRVPDPLAEACSWLSGQMRWLRHAVDDQGSPVAPDVFAEIADCAGRMRSLVNGPAVQKFLGPCGSTIAWEGDDSEIEVNLDEPCAGDVYGNPGAEMGSCRTCGARWSVAKRQAWLDAEVREHAYRAAQIADAYGVNENSIRTWSTRIRPDTGQPALASWWRTDEGLLVPWTDPEGGTAEGIRAELAARGPRLHFVGDVLDLAAAAAARRETERAKRARREAAALAAESEDAA